MLCSTIMCSPVIIVEDSSAGNSSQTRVCSKSSNVAALPLTGVEHYVSCILIRTLTGKFTRLPLTIRCVPLPDVKSCSPVPHKDIGLIALNFVDLIERLQPQVLYFSTLLFSY